MPEDKNKVFAASLLAADFTDFAGAIETAERAGAGWLHLDVMDGRFVPNLTFGAKMVSDIRKRTKLTLDVHLMIEAPEDHARHFLDAGADNLTFHLEATTHIHRLITEIRKHGKKAGISIVPSTPVSALTELLPIVDIVLILTVNPGFGGQKLIPACLEKVRQLRNAREQEGYGYLIEVDGGVNRETALQVRQAGADILVAGSAFFSSDNPAHEVRTITGTNPV